MPACICRPDGFLYAVKVYVPDEDTIQTAATISLLFDFQAHFGLDLVQPSLCSPADSYTSDPSLFQQQPTTLRFTAWVDVTVPAFSMRFLLTKVLPTLRHVRTGEQLHWACVVSVGLEAAAACKARAGFSAWVHVAASAFSMQPLLKHVLAMLQHVRTGEAVALCMQSKGGA